MEALVGLASLQAGTVAAGPTGTTEHAQYSTARMGESDWAQAGHDGVAILSSREESSGERKNTVSDFVQGATLSECLGQTA